MRNAHKSHAPSIMEDSESLLNSCFCTDTFESCICSATKDFTDLGNAFFTTLRYDCCRTKFQSHLLTVLVATHKDDLRCTTHLSCNDSTLANSTVTNNDNLVTFLHISYTRCMIARRHDISQRQEGFEHGFCIIRWLPWNFDKGPIGKVETDVLCLHPVRPVGADMAVTSPIITSTTGITLPTTMGGRDNKVSWFNRCNGFSDFFDDTNSFVTTILMTCFNIRIAVAP